jgi:hypothetical protein
MITEYGIGNTYVKRLAELQGSKCIVFDSGPIISFATNNLLSTLERLKEHYPGKFILPESVKAELVDEPLKTKRFMFEALQVQRLISKGVFEILEDDDTKELTLEILNLANSSFSAKSRQVKLVHYAEIASIAAARLLEAEAVVIDERVTRELIENPGNIPVLMEKRLHMPVFADNNSLALLRKYSSGIKLIRSVELIFVAAEKGLLDRYVAPGEEQVIPEIRQKLLESVLWGLKMNGCSINSKEIDALIALSKSVSKPS